MIMGFRHNGLKRYWENNDRSGLNQQHISRIEQILDLLDASQRPEDMNLRNLRFHKLTGLKPDRWSVRVSANYRITFSFEGEHAVALDYEDYH
jgi:toxin HigB-1